MTTNRCPEMTNSTGGGGRNPVLGNTPLRDPEAARYIGMSTAFLRQARMRAKGPAYFRIGRSIRYRVSDLDRWLAARRVVTRDQAA